MKPRSANISAIWLGDAGYVEIVRGAGAGVIVERRIEYVLRSITTIKSYRSANTRSGADEGENGKRDPKSAR